MENGCLSVMSSAKKAKSVAAQLQCFQLSCLVFYFMYPLKVITDQIAWLNPNVRVKLWINITGYYNLVSRPFSSPAALGAGGADLHKGGVQGS